MSTKSGKKGKTSSIFKRPSVSFRNANAARICDCSASLQPKK
jgi:hypothetical protein